MPPKPPQYETKAKDRIRKGLQRYTDVLKKATERGLNEEDTSTIVHAMLVDLLGYERFWEIAGQYRTRGRFADWAVKLEDKVQFFVEVKQLGDTLRERDLFQVISYSVQQDLSWSVLTTGDVWQCHRISTGKDVKEFFEVRMLDASQPLEEKVESFYLLSKEGVSRSALDAHWAHAEAYRPEKLCKLLFSDDVLNALRRLVRRENPNRRVDITDLREALLRGVIRGDLQAAVTEAQSNGQTRPTAKSEKLTI